MNMCFHAASRLLENRKPIEVSMFYRYYAGFLVELFALCTDKSIAVM